MSYSFAISNGDLVLRGSNLGIIWGIDKLKQDLQIWLTEAYGTDRFHPTMGCLLESFIGGTVSYATQNAVESELLRVLNNYQAVQLRALRAHPQIFSLSELLYSIDSINVHVSYDTVSAHIGVHTADGVASAINVASST